MSASIADRPYEEFIDLESYRFLGDGATRTLKGFFIGPPNGSPNVDSALYSHGQAWRKGSPVTITIPRANGSNVSVGFKDCVFSNTAMPQSTSGTIPADACGFIGSFSGPVFVDTGGYDASLRTNFEVVAASLPWPFARSDANGLVSFGRVELGTNYFKESEGGYTPGRFLDLNKTGQIGKAAPAKLGWLWASNHNTTSAIFVKVYNLATAPTSASTPIMTFEIPPGSSGSLFQSEKGLTLSAGLSFRCTTGVADNDNVDPTANDCIINFGYQ